MTTMTVENMKAELSYAYLHAVASHAGFACTYTGRHADNAGVDADVSAYGQLATDSILTDFKLEVQLKATAKQRRVTKKHPGHYSFSLDVSHYNKLRKTTTGSQRILVVLYLPKKRNHWLSHSADSLVTRRCAYWVSLRGAQDTANAANQTIYIPKTNVLSVDALADIMVKSSRQEWINYGC